MKKSLLNFLAMAFLLADGRPVLGQPAPAENPAAPAAPSSPASDGSQAGAPSPSISVPPTLPGPPVAAQPPSIGGPGSGGSPTAGVVRLPARNPGLLRSRTNTPAGPVITAVTNSPAAPMAPAADNTNAPASPSALTPALPPTLPPLTRTAPTAAGSTNANPTALGATAPPGAPPGTPPAGPPAGFAGPPGFPPPPGTTPPGSTNIIRSMPPLPAAPPASMPTVNPEDAAMPAIAIKFPNAPIEQVLDFYAELVGRTVLKSPMIPPNTTVTLKAQTPLTRAEARQALDTVLALNNISMIPVGERFVTAIPATQALQEGAAFNKDDASQLPEAAQFITQIVHLTNALPSEVVTAIQPFAKVPGGIVPIDSSQILVLRDYAINVKRMLEVIKRVDVTSESDYKLEVIPIKYGKVEDIYNVMSGLISGGGGAPGVAGATSSRSRMGATSNRAGRSGSSSMMNRRTGAGLNQAGQQPQAAGAPQSAFQQRLQQIVSRAAGGETQLMGDARIIPDDRSNSLVVYATKHDMEMVTNVVAKLDVALAQVLIEAIVLEVSLDDSLKFGVSAVQRKQTESGKFTGAGIMDNGQGFLSNLGNLATNSGGGGGGFSYFGKWANDLDVTVEALSKDSTINVMSRPRIQTTHAVAAEFFVGDTVPYLTGTYYSDYSSMGNRSSYQQLEVGITLSVTPYITPDGLVVMEIDQDISQLGTSVKIDNNDVPTTTSRRQKATVSVEDGRTIMLGGYITSNKSRSKSGVPGLKDIPLLGALFRTKTDINKRVELIVMMRPTVLHTPKDASLVAEREKQRLPGVVIAEKEFKAEEQKRLDSTEKKMKKK